MTPSSETKVRRVLEHVAQQIVYCNCATEGPARKRCEHVALAEHLEHHFLPLLLAGQALCDASIMPDGLERSEAWVSALTSAARPSET